MAMLSWRGVVDSGKKSGAVMSGVLGCAGGGLFPGGFVFYGGVGGQTGNEGGVDEEVNWCLYTSIFKENMEYICIILFISGSARLPSAINSKTYPLIIIFP